MATINALSKDLEEIKRSLNSMGQEMIKICKQQSNLIQLLDEVRELKEQLIQRDKRIEILEQRIDDMEQRSLARDVVITGLDVKHRSYARVTAGLNEGAEAPTEELQTLEQQLLDFIKGKSITLEKENVSTCYTFPKKDPKSKPTIVIEFVNFKLKMELLKQSRKLKGTGIFLNEHLTKKNGEIARYGRLLRKQQKIQSTWTRNGRVYIKPNGSDQVKPIMIKNLKELEQYK